VNRPLLLGHRGARAAAPENSLAAFDLALAHGCDGFEFDVRFTRDAKAVICHDARLAHRSVRRSTYAQLCDRLGRKMPRGMPPPSLLPSLDDVLARFGNRAWLDIEIKVAGLEKTVLDAIERHRLRRNFCVSSFRPGVLAELRARDPGVPLGFLTDKRWRLARWERYDVQVVIPHYRLVSARLVDEVHAAGKILITWTVNSARRMRRLADLGVDGIVSDDTELLIRTLGRS
jgi:glycerophosphoryl diester phosphodiesterase